MIDAAAAKLSQVFDQIYSCTGRPSIPPEKLLRALLLQVLYSVRSERMLMEQLQYNVLFRWFVGIDMGRFGDTSAAAAKTSPTMDRLVETIDNTFRQTNLPNESDEYLAKREELRLPEIELMHLDERVADLRRQLLQVRRSRTMHSKSYFDLNMFCGSRLKYQN